MYADEYYPNSITVTLADHCLTRAHDYVVYLRASDGYDANVTTSFTQRMSLIYYNNIILFLISILGAVPTANFGFNSFVGERSLYRR